MLKIYEKIVMCFQDVRHPGHLTVKTKSAVAQCRPCRRVNKQEIGPRSFRGETPNTKAGRKTQISFWKGVYCQARKGKILDRKYLEML